MLSKYFETKTSEPDFNNHLHNLINSLKNKRVIIYGAGQGFEELNKKYKFNEALNVVAFADKKFEKCPAEKCHDIKAICPKDITKEKFDYVLVTNERANSIIKYLKDDMDIPEDKIKTIFTEDIKDECDNLNYLYKFNFDKTLPHLVKKLSNKKVVLYGAGAFLELIQKYFDLSEINIVAVADRRFAHHDENENFLGYKVISPDEIKTLKPDYVIVVTKYYINIIEDLYYNLLADTKIKIKPILKKSLLTLIKEIWG